MIKSKNLQINFNQNKTEFMVFSLAILLVIAIANNDILSIVIFGVLNLLSLPFIVIKLFGKIKDSKHNHSKNYKIYFDASSNVYKNSLNQFCLNGKIHRQVIVVCDNNLLSQVNLLMQNIASSNKTLISLDSCGEDIKSFASFESLLGKILALKPTRNTLLIAFGGGTVGDLTGFCASVLLRGIDYIQYPTTLLSMVDSSVGGKTAINTQTSKNMIGSFYQPVAVFCDARFLNTLSVGEFLSGYGEVIKYGLIADKNFLQFLLNNENLTTSIIENIRNQQPFTQNQKEFLDYIIKTCCKIKAQIVSKDEMETKGIREFLNFGHTIGHGLEKCDKFKNKISHGQAVASGMLYELELSNFKNVKNLITTLKNHYQAIGLLTNLDITENIPQIMQIISADKKNKCTDFVEIEINDVKTSVRKYISICVLQNIAKPKNLQISSHDLLKVLLK